MELDLDLLEFTITSKVKEFILNCFNECNVSKEDKEKIIESLCLILQVMNKGE